MSRNAARYRVLKFKVDRVLCHRVRETEEYLIVWKTAPNNARNAVVSWHPVNELGSIAEALQVYVEDFRRSLDTNGLQQPPVSLKRKSPGDDNSHPDQNIWNGYLQRKLGDIYTKEIHPDSPIQVARIDATALPTSAMRAGATAYGKRGVSEARNLIQTAFQNQITRISGPSPPVTFRNTVDRDTPSLSFTFIQDYILGEGVSRADDETRTGCRKCRPDMGGNKGCEYTKICECLEYATPNLSWDDELYIEWQEGRHDGSGLPKRFPYRRTPNGGINDYVLDGFYLESRNVVYECNSQCRCGPNCKNRMVQHGRKVPLEIFKTEKRGFGLRCPVPLKRGQFIDKYLGELITDQEADRREARSGPGKASYLFWLDKHANDEEGPLHSSDCYVADGERMGGPTRFINHSCDPNCRLFTVSYNRHDYKIYDLAFFALYDIPAGEELTFDYMDPEDGEAGLAEREEYEELEGEEGKVAVPCLCGAKKCRGKLWM